jgi:hypothetical protein
MNVKISYTIPFKQIPEHINKVLRDAADPASNIENRLRYFMESDDQTDGINEIDEIRKKMASLDLLLRDCYNILVGYNEALEGNMPQTNQKEDLSE